MIDINYKVGLDDRKGVLVWEDNEIGNRYTGSLELTNEFGSIKETCTCVSNAESVSSEKCKCVEGYQQNENECVSNSDNNGLEKWEIALIVIGCIILCIGIVVGIGIAIFFIRKILLYFLRKKY